MLPSDFLKYKIRIMTEIASALKIAYHRSRLDEYLSGRPIFPVTLELDLTSSCTRFCSDCPSSRGKADQNLSFGFVQSLFMSLKGQTRGLLLTGGEPTMSPLFPRVLELARQCSFKEIAVVTNGSLLDRGAVAEALLKNASVIRVSLYDWSSKSCGGIASTLRRITSLRNAIERNGSSLQIGVSVLTSDKRAGVLGQLAASIRSAGAHWIYFHPKCTGWDLGSPDQVNQGGVLQAVQYCRTESPEDFGVYLSRSRYERDSLSFRGYHAGFFLLVIGADGKNYLAPEVKYQPRHVISDVIGEGVSDFLRGTARLKRMQSVDSRTYPALASRHRGVLYSNLIEQLKSKENGNGLNGSPGFRYPHIL